MTDHTLRTSATSTLNATRTSTVGASGRRVLGALSSLALTLGLVVIGVGQAPQAEAAAATATATTHRQAATAAAHARAATATTRRAAARVAVARAGVVHGVESAFVSQLNAARRAHGLAPYALSADLVSVARAQAARMARAAKLAHNPHLATAVHNYRWVGENVGYGPDAATVHTAFMNSPLHKANILDRDFHQVGVGVVITGDRVWVAQVFRDPAPKPVPLHR